jgi:hypothetical protein
MAIADTVMVLAICERMGRVRDPGDDLADDQLPACCSAARRDRDCTRGEGRPLDGVRRGRDGC